MSTAIWAGRLEGKADDLFREFNDSLPLDVLAHQRAVEGKRVVELAEEVVGLAFEPSGPDRGGHLSLPSFGVRVVS
ncbi:MAG: hypothetical protein ACKOYN_09655, partial [Planctomycetota bacterium]